MAAVIRSLRLPDGKPEQKGRDHVVWNQWDIGFFWSSLFRRPDRNYSLL